MRVRSKKGVRGELREKIENDEPPLTPKSNMFDHEKTYINAMP